ncbi:Mannose-specific lectin [Carex littledalei]|uniref:non-specific serine/threonine protein kinase n=1 Tax=Carex littledalei TaxID=544730 RepID=A0A833VMQ0_9POAL|nr:Mannose-specific lectin [Carex littledalei]
MSFLTFLLTSLLILPIALGIPVPLDLAPDFMLSGETLQPNGYLQNGNCIFKMQSDCNLVLYENGSLIWASQTANQGTNCNLAMQYDGNLVMYDGDGNALWQSNTAKDVSGTYPCVITSNCNVQIFGENQWSTAMNNIA